MRLVTANSALRWVLLISKSAHGLIVNQSHQNYFCYYHYYYYYYYYNYYDHHYYYNCVNNKMLEYDWLLPALIYGLIGCFRSKLSDLTCPTTNICNRTSQIGQLSSQCKLSTSCHQPINFNYLAHPSQSKSSSYVSLVERCRLKTNMDEINWFNDFYSDMFSLDFDSLFSTVDLQSFSHFVIDNQLVIGLRVVQFKSAMCYAFG